MRRAFRLAVLVAASLPLRSGIVVLADITGDAATHAVSTTSVAAQWVQFLAQSGNAGTCRVGDGNTSTSRGIPLGAGAGFYMAPGKTPYVLTGLSYNCASGDKITIAYGD